MCLESTAFIVTSEFATTHRDNAWTLCGVILFDVGAIRIFEKKTISNHKKNAKHLSVFHLHLIPCTNLHCWLLAVGSWMLAVGSTVQWVKRLYNCNWHGVTCQPTMIQTRKATHVLYLLRAGYNCTQLVKYSTNFCYEEWRCAHLYETDLSVR